MPPSLLCPHSCRHCSKIVLDFRRANSSEECSKDDRSLNETPFLLRIDCTNPNSNSELEWSILEDGAKDGCVFFSFLINLSQPQQPSTCSQHIKARLSLSQMGVVFETSSNRVNFFMASELDDVASMHINVRPVNPHTASDKSFQLARQWLAQCLESHPDCRAIYNGPEFIPTRLVEIIKGGPEWKVHLHHPSTSMDYIALSYCWGGYQTFLTQRVKKKWETEIPWEDLSKTIQEAILVTLKLGLRYIWIDALCIVQDDNGDKIREIAKMSQIYSSATLTIAASTAKAAYEGFLQDREVTDFPEDVFKLPVQCQTGDVGTAVLFRPQYTNYRISDPLNSRAWGLQERFLSQRILEFKKLQLKWTCPTSLTSQFSQPTKMPMEYVDGWWNDFEDSLIEPADDALVQWRNIVYSYTLRDLTVPTDRILAISGVAEALTTVIEGEYWAGLWQIDFPIALMWRSTPSTPSDADDLSVLSGTLLPRPICYQGPSWSWVSVNMLASYRGYDSGVESVLEFLKCDIKPVDCRAPYGAVESAYLSVQGRTQAALLRYDHSAGGFHKSRWKLEMVDNEYSDKGLIYANGDALEPEFASAGTSELRVCLLEVLRRRVDGPDNGHSDAISEGLMLRELTDQQYSRVGTFSCYIGVQRGEGTEQCRWFDDCPTQKLTII